MADDRAREDDVAPDGPHEVISQVFRSAYVTHRRFAIAVVVLAVALVTVAILNFVGLSEIQSDRNARIKDGNARTVQTTQILNQLQADQAAIPGKVDARLCDLVNALTDPRRPVDAGTKALRDQIHCPVPTVKATPTRP